MQSILDEVKRTINHWWLFLLLGIFLITAGLIVAFTPESSYVALSVFFIVIVFVNGVFNILFANANRNVLRGWGYYLSGGIMQLFLGVVFVAQPEMTMDTLPLLLGFWLLTGAASAISSALELKAYAVNSWIWLLLLGILLMIIGFFVNINSEYSVASIVVLTSLAFIIFGVSYVLFGMLLKQIRGEAGDLKEEVTNYPW